MPDLEISKDRLGSVDYRLLQDDDLTEGKVKGRSLRLEVIDSGHVAINGVVAEGSSGLFHLTVTGF